MARAWDRKYSPPKASGLGEGKSWHREVMCLGRRPGSLDTLAKKVYQVRASKVKLTTNRAGWRRARRMSTTCRVVRAHSRVAAVNREELLGILHRPLQRKMCGIAGWASGDGGSELAFSSRSAYHHS